MGVASREEAELGPGGPLSNKFCHQIRAALSDGNILLLYVLLASFHWDVVLLQVPGNRLSLLCIKQQLFSSPPGVGLSSQ